MCVHLHAQKTNARAEGESAGEGDEENRLMMMAGSGGEEWGAGAKDRQQTTFSQPEQSYEAAFNKVWHTGHLVAVYYFEEYLRRISIRGLAASNICCKAHPRGSIAVYLILDGTTRRFPSPSSLLSYIGGEQRVPMYSSIGSTPQPFISIGIESES